MLLLSLAFLALAFRLFQIQVANHSRYRAVAEEMHGASEPVQSYRGDITLSDGVIVARDVLGYEVGLDPEFIAVADLPETVRVVCEGLGLPPGDQPHWLARVLAAKREGGRYVRLGEQAGKAELAEIEEALARVLAKGGLRGFVKLPKAARTYPRGSFLAAAVGVTNSAGEGIEGVEKSMDAYLSPRNGWREFLVDASPRRNKVFDLGNADVAPAETYDVRLTIDSRVQTIAEEELEAGVLRQKAAAGVMAILDCQTGDVLAMASYPTYAPERFRSYSASERHDRRKNSAVEKLYEPGSVLKPFIVGRALERGEFRLEERVRALMPPQVSWDGGKEAHFGSRSVRDTHEHEDMTIEDVVVHSSNIGMSILGLNLGRDGLIDVLESFGFCRRTGIDLPAEAKGKHTRPADWKPLYSSVSVAFGYEVLVSPIQLCRAFAALVNGGFLLRPRIVERLERGGQVFVFPQRQVVGRPLSEEASREMRRVLREVVRRGTARWLEVEGFEFGAKTGTAVMNRDGNYQRGDYLASFEAFAPYEEPRFVVLCILERPRGGSYYGSMVAGPIVVNVLRRLFGVTAPTRLEKTNAEL